MKSRSVFASLVALAAVFSLAFTMSPGSAQAAGPGVSTTAAAAKAQQPHRATIRSGEIRNTGRFYSRGVVRTANPGQRIYLQRKPRGGSFFTAQNVIMGQRHRFGFNFDGPVGTCFRLRINSNPQYRQFTYRIGCIVRG